MFAHAVTIDNLDVAGAARAPFQASEYRYAGCIVQN